MSRDVFLALLAVAVVVTLTVCGSATGAGLLRQKPTEKQYFAILRAKAAALGKLGLVMQRNCDFDDLRCLNNATSVEAAAAAKVSQIAAAVAKTLAPGR